MFCCSPFPVMHLSGLPSQDTPLYVGECGIHWGGIGEGCALCASGSRAKGAPGRRWLGQGWWNWGIFSSLGKMKEESKHSKEHCGNSGQSVPVFSCGGCQPSLLQLWSDLSACSCYLCTVSASCPPHGFPCKSNLFLMEQFPLSPFLVSPAVSHSPSGWEGRRGHKECIPGLHRGKDVEELLL